MLGSPGFLPTSEFNCIKIFYDIKRITILLIHITIANPDSKAEVLLEAFNLARLKYSFLQCGAFGFVFIFMPLFNSSDV